MEKEWKLCNDLFSDEDFVAPRKRKRAAPKSYLEDDGFINSILKTSKESSKKQKSTKNADLPLQNGLEMNNQEAKKKPKEKKTRKKKEVTTTKSNPTTDVETPPNQEFVACFLSMIKLSRGFTKVYLAPYRGSASCIDFMFYNFVVLVNKEIYTMLTKS